MSVLREERVSRELSMAGPVYPQMIPLLLTAGLAMGGLLGAGNNELQDTTRIFSK